MNVYAYGACHPNHPACGISPLVHFSTWEEQARAMREAEITPPRETEEFLPEERKGRLFIWCGERIIWRD